jgi:UDP-N-acetylbacillosamine N-acetyltransferase
MQKIVILGASGHALVAIDILRQQSEFQIIGLIDDVNPQLHGTIFDGLPILGGREQLSELKSQNIDRIFVAIGNNTARMREGSYLRSLGFDIVTVIHPKSIVAPDIRIGSGTAICAGAVVVTGSQIGQDVIINTCASVDHECTIEDGVHIGPGVHIGGRTTIRKGAWMGIGAIVSDRITIGESSTIGAGSVVIRDIPPGVVAYGVPAKVMREI